MNQFRFAIPLLVAVALAGCATDGPATSGASERAAMASQVISPQPPAQRQPAVADGVAAVAVYKNFVESYTSPRPQVEDSAFRK